jgi:hypothetical protein
MTRILLLLLVLAGLVAGCASDNTSGSREFVPGKGWIPTR